MPIWDRLRRSQRDREEQAEPLYERQFQSCAGCHMSGRPLVYCENGRSYCLPCFVKADAFLHLKSIGRRDDDLDPETGVTLGELRGALDLAE